MKNNRQEPQCITCRHHGRPDYQPGGDFFQCPNCGTEMRYLPAGELWQGNNKKKKKKNNGWVTTFSVPDCDLAPHQTTTVLGIGTVVLAIVFLILGKIDLTAFLMTACAGIVITVFGRKKTLHLAAKIRSTKEHFPHWHR